MKNNMFWSKKSYKVKISGRSRLIYIENKKEMNIDCEMLYGPEYGIVIYSDSITSWEEPFNKETITEDKKNEILENTKLDLEAYKYKVEID